MQQNSTDRLQAMTGIQEIGDMVDGKLLSVVSSLTARAAETAGDRSPSAQYKVNEEVRWLR